MGRKCAWWDLICHAQNFGESVASAVGGIGKFIGDTVSGAVKGAQEFVGGVAKTVSDVASGVVKTAQDVVGGAGKFVGDVTKGVADTVGGAVNGIVNFVSSEADAFGGIVAGIGVGALTNNWALATQVVGKSVLDLLDDSDRKKIEQGKVDKELEQKLIQKGATPQQIQQLRYNLQPVAGTNSQMIWIIIAIVGAVMFIVILMLALNRRR